MGNHHWIGSLVFRAPQLIGLGELIDPYYGLMLVREGQRLDLQEIRLSQ